MRLCRSADGIYSARRCYCSCDNAPTLTLGELRRPTHAVLPFFNFDPGRNAAWLLQHAPENTLAHFRACLELRLGFELDVRCARDGTLVVLHDETLDRTTDGTGPVSAIPQHELQQLDAGSWFDPRFSGERIPTVDQVFQLLTDYPDAAVLVAVDGWRAAASAGIDAILTDYALELAGLLRSPPVKN
jgi:hypothetical protein